MLPALLRAGAVVSERVLGGHAIRLGSRMTARLLATQDRKVWFSLAGGGYLLVDADDGLWLKSLLIDRSYEADVDQFLGRTLRASDRFIDCGANIGLWSVLAAQTIRDPARIVAIEAGSRQFAQLESNRAANRHAFTALRRAVSDRSGDTVKFYSTERDHVSATMVSELAPRDASGQTVESVTTTSLVDLLRQTPATLEEGAVTFVKLDIEGMEQVVISTLDAAVHRDVVLLYEDHGRDTSDATTRLLLERGFTVAFLTEDGSIESITRSTLARMRALKVSATRGYNLVAVSPSGSAAARLHSVYGRPGARPDTTATPSALNAQ